MSAGVAFGVNFATVVEKRLKSYLTSLAGKICLGLEVGFALGGLGTLKPSLSAK